MLYHLIQDLNRLLRAELPEIRLIDFDRGQLQKPERYESILQPAVLLGIPNINWRELAKRNQEGDMTFVTKTIVRLPHDTFLYNDLPIEQNAALDANIAENVNELMLEDAVHQQITTLEGVCRTRSAFYFVNTFFVAEHTYGGYVYYEAQERYTRRPINVNINAQIKPKL